MTLPNALVRKFFVSGQNDSGVDLTSKPKAKGNQYTQVERPSGGPKQAERF